MSQETVNATSDYFTAIRDLIQSKMSFLKIKKEQIETDIEDCTVTPGGYNEREQGIHLFSTTYRAVIYVDRLLADRIPYLMAMVQVFIESMERQSREEYPHPQYELIKLDKAGKYYNVEIYIELIDDVYLTPDEEGPIEWEGQSYDIADNSFLLAEEGEVSSGVRQ